MNPSTAFSAEFVKGINSTTPRKKIYCFTVAQKHLTEKELKKINKLAVNLTKLPTENSLRFLELCSNETHLYYVFEKNDGYVNFSEALKKEVTKAQAEKIAQGLVNSLTSYQENEMKPVHINPNNILLQKLKKVQLAIPNIEFMLEKTEFYEERYDLMDEDMKKYMAPEIVKEEKFKKDMDQEKCLVYSLGITLQHLYSKVKGKKDDIQPSEEFLKTLTKSNPKKRPSLDDLQEEEWMSTEKKKVKFDPNIPEEEKSPKQKLKPIKQEVENKDGGRKWNESGKEFKRGAFTPEEIDILKHAVCRYVLEHNLELDGMNKLIVNNRDEDIKGAWCKIAECLPDRTVQSCHNLVRRKFHPYNYKGKWLEKEEEELFLLVEQKGKKWEEIAAELERTPTNVRDKYKSMGAEHSDKRKKGAWTSEEIIQLLRIIENKATKKFLRSNIEKNLKDVLQVNSIEYTFKKQRKHKIYDEFLTKLADYIDIEKAKTVDYTNLDWTNIASQMQTRSKDDCRNLWYSQIYNTISQACDFTPSEDEALVEAIGEQGVENEEELDFEKIENGKDKNENRARWKQLQKAMSNRLDKNLFQSIKAIKTQLKYEEESTKYKIVKDGTGDNALISLYKTQYNK